MLNVFWYGSCSYLEVSKESILRVSFSVAFNALKKIKLLEKVITGQNPLDLDCPVYNVPKGRTYHWKNY